MKLLIAGSRNASPVMRRRAREAVEKAKAQGDVEIIVGDADGVDRAVVQACIDLGVSFTCYGKHFISRLSFCPSDHYEKQGSTYWERDEYMASICDAGLFIWDGKSKGTMYTRRCCQKLNKQTWLINFSKGRRDPDLGGG